MLLLPRKRLGRALQIADKDLPEDLGRDGIVVLVKGTAHARTLHKLLPEWQVCHERPMPLPGCDDVKKTKRVQPRIMTLVYAWRHGVSARIVIWASAGWRGPSLNEYPLYAWAGRDHILLIDVLDQEDGVNTVDSQRRIEYYGAHGWYILTPETGID
jgi:hypothetical protein